MPNKYCLTYATVHISCNCFYISSLISISHFLDGKCFLPFFKSLEWLYLLKCMMSIKFSTARLQVHGVILVKICRNLLCSTQLFTPKTKIRLPLLPGMLSLFAGSNTLLISGCLGFAIFMDIEKLWEASSLSHPAILATLEGVLL